MDTTKLIAIAGLLVSLSVASERLVEIIKGLIPWLDKDKTDTQGVTAADQASEGRRRSVLLTLAVIAGWVTSWLAWPAISSVLAQANIAAEDDKVLWVVSLGLLASGGSSVWNSVLTYLLSVKDLKETGAKAAKLKVAA